MPRANRITQAGVLHHVISRGNANQAIFRDLDDYKKYLSLLKEAAAAHPIAVYNYALLKSTIHLLVEPLQDNALSKAMESVTREYAKYFNQKYNSIGHVFAGRFKSFAIQPDQFFMACSRYIDLIPTKHELVKEAKDYSFSGYAQLALGNRGDYPVDQHELYKALGSTDAERQLVYRTLVNQYLGVELDLENRKSGILGSREYKQLVKSGVNMRKTELRK
ncbi:MAG: transposase [Candidatus Omnitrophica bacterium]|nr:transposase [Candidatus Omnitrophota bacterium]